LQQALRVEAKDPLKLILADLRRQKGDLQQLMTDSTRSRESTATLLKKIEDLNRRIEKLRKDGNDGRDDGR
jgi:hypothetical protein